MLRATIKSNCLFFSSKQCVGCFPWQIFCWSPNLASAQTGKYCNSNRLALPCNPKFGNIPTNDRVPLPHVWQQTLLGMVVIAKLDVCFPASISWSCYIVAASPISACWGRAVKVADPPPSYSLLIVSTAPLNIALQMFNGRMTLPSYLQL